jgi:hypothetical protein
MGHRLTKGTSGKAMRIPGIIYSLLLAVAAWAIEYFTQGPGSSMSYAPILIAVIPVLLKMITVHMEPTQPQAAARGMGDAQPSKIERFLLG